MRNAGEIYQMYGGFCDNFIIKPLECWNFTYAAWFSVKEFSVNWKLQIFLVTGTSGGWG